MCSNGGHLDWHNAVQCVLHYASSPLHTAGASPAQCAGLAIEVGSGRPQCGGGLPVCKRQLPLLGSCRQDMQAFPAASRAHPLWPLELPALLAGAQQLLETEQTSDHLTPSLCHSFNALPGNHVGSCSTDLGSACWCRVLRDFSQALC